MVTNKVEHKMDLFNNKKLAKTEKLLSDCMIELHDHKALKDNIVDSINQDKVKLKNALLKEKRKKRPDLDKLHALNLELEIFSRVQNRIIDNHWSE